MTIPIWLALRGAMMGVSSTFQNGIRDIIEFDRALQKVKQNLSGTPEEIATNFKILRKEVTETSLKLGISTEEIAESIKKFASLGFVFEESMAGGLGAAKLATVLFGDASETADSFARAMNLLIDRSKGATSAQQQMNEMYALAAKLEKTNQFEIKEINDSLKNFAGTAKSFNLTGKQTLAILATLGTSLLEGARGGTAASTAFQQMVSNFSKVGDVLGLKIDPNKVPIIDIFIQIIEAIERLNKTDIVASTKAINTLFGGLKAAKPIRALIADLGKLRENLSMTAPLSEFEARVNDVTNTLSKQSDRFHNLNKEIGKAFVGGVVGAEDFGTALKNINSYLEIMQTIAPKAGHALMTAITGFGTFGIGIPILAFAEEEKRIAIAFDDLNKEITKGLQGKLKTAELRELIIKIGPLKLEHIGQQPRNALGKQLQKQMTWDLEPVSTDIIVKPEIDSIIPETRIKYLDYEKHLREELKLQGLSELEVEQSMLPILETKVGYISEEVTAQKQLIAHLQRLEEIDLKRSKIRGVIDNQLEYLRLLGASGLELVQYEIQSERLYGIDQKRQDLLQNELSVQREITKEKFNQNKVSSDSLKLFEISKKYNVRVARETADILNKPLTENTLRNIEEKNLTSIFEEFFKSQLEQAQALEFFLTTWEGLSIPTTEKLRRDILNPPTQPILQNGTWIQPTPERTIQTPISLLPTMTPNLPAITTNVGGINIEIKKLFSDVEIAKQIKNAMLEAIRNNPDIEKAINEKIDEF
jgi:TP901 family phage tail tape measure protein